MNWTSSVNRVLCLGAHSDDIEIGAGGAILRLLEERPATSVCWIVFSHSGNAQRLAEARNSAQAFLAGAGERRVLIHDFRDGFFPTHLERIKECFEQIKTDFSPDLVLTHARDDLHQDHRAINGLTWNTFRSHAIWEYEIPKWDGDLGQPNLFVQLSPEQCVRKIQCLLAHFPSQAPKHWFSEETFRALMRLRGVEANCRYAEAFYARKITV